MTTQTEALKLALEHIEGNYTVSAKDAITAIKEALAQPEQCKYGQEPKSCTSSPMDCQCAIDATLAQPEQEPDDLTIAYMSGYHDGKKAQRTWVGLTDGDFAEACQIAERGNYLVAFQRIQAKLKEKNT